jgi:acyl-CoA dehydrogenase
MNDLAGQRDAQADEVSAIVLEQADRLFREQVTVERLAQADAGAWLTDVWQQLEQAGLPLAAIAEAQGGSALPLADVLRIVRRAAYYALPLPLAETMMGNLLWADAAGQAIAGRVSLAPTWANEVQIEQQGSGWLVSGRAQRVPWGSQVERVLLLAYDQRESIYLVLMPAHAAEVEHRRNLAHEPRDTLSWSRTPVHAVAARPVAAEVAEQLMLLGALFRAQQMVGAMERSLDYTLSYAMERKQFGRPIAKFQAVQHMLAEAAGHYAAAAAAADLARDAYGQDDFSFCVAIAKARVGEAAGKVAEVSHQVHGAMGFTQEHALHFVTRRLWSWRDEFGNESYWQQRIGRLVCQAGGEALWPMLAGD